MRHRAPTLLGALCFAALLRGTEAAFDRLTTAMAGPRLGARRPSFDQEVPMSRTQRFGLLALALAVVVVAAIVIGTGGSDSSTTSAGPTTIEVRNAKPVGGVKTLTYKQGATIDLTVKSDTADEVHFHGYDVHKDVAKNGSVRFDFPAKIDGQFIVELEDHKQTLANVTVEP